MNPQTIVFAILAILMVILALVRPALKARRVFNLQAEFNALCVKARDEGALCAASLNNALNLGLQLQQLLAGMRVFEDEYAEARERRVPEYVLDEIAQRHGMVDEMQRRILESARDNSRKAGERLTSVRAIVAKLENFETTSTSAAALQIQLRTVRQALDGAVPMLQQIDRVLSECAAIQPSVPATGRSGLQEMRGGPSRFLPAGNNAPDPATARRNIELRLVLRQAFSIAKPSSGGGPGEKL